MGRVAVGHRAVVALRAHHVLDVEWVTAKRLPPEVTAQVIRAYGETEVQVNDLVPFSGLRDTARHTVEHHIVGCYTRACPYARMLMREVAARAVAAADAESA